jgi:hypothetical protein
LSTGIGGKGRQREEKGKAEGRGRKENGNAMIEVNGTGTEPSTQCQPLFLVPYAIFLHSSLEKTRRLC